jgi:D-tyrosyl-tRNA(Tyr) deacylase
MRLLVQRVSQASVKVDQQTISKIGNGLLILLGIGHDDGEEQAAFLAEKTANLRIFEDEQGKTNLSILDVKGEAIVVSQFTLYADTSPLVDRFVQLLRSHGVPTQTGQFGAHMEVEIHNDGPVTIWLEK